MNRPLQVAKYVLSDLFAAGLAWGLFFWYRKLVIETQKYGEPFMVNLKDDRFLQGLVAIPLLWLAFYAITGTYRNIYRKSRLRELGQTLLSTLIGVTFLFFLLILDDDVIDYTTYYQSYGVLFALHFGITAIGRFVLSSITASGIQKGRIGFPTLIIGSDDRALELVKEFETQHRSSGNQFIGFLNVKDKPNYVLSKKVQHLGSLADLQKMIEEHGVEEVIIAIESSEHEEMQDILTRLEGCRPIIKVIPDMYDIMSGSVKMSAIYGTPLIEISHDLMPAWEVVVKRAGDIVVSILSLMLLSPLYLLTALGVKTSSPGPIFYRQERIGKGGKPFMMIKFRSMRQDAEKAGPALSSDNDPRITSFGKFMRKVRLDETPQFWNVLIGDMSLVGPRPERQYFIDQIVKEAPHYKHLLKVRPGITSWGMVKYGYAENVEQMIRRMKYDLLYIENMGIGVDLKILIYTVLTVIQGRGK
jgi:exopolysaccharide biosynthesis polyprenyl glycosylphosphotransferase